MSKEEQKKKTKEGANALDFQDEIVHIPHHLLKPGLSAIITTAIPAISSSLQCLTKSMACFIKGFFRRI